MTKRIFLGMLTPSSNTALEPLTSAMLAGLPEVSAHCGRFKVTEISLDAVQDKIVASFVRHGLTLVAERHLNICVNFDFSEVSETLLETMIREVAQTRPQCITTYCTNLRAMRMVDRLERDTGIPIYDSIATTVWKSLRIAGVDARRVEDWGSLFREAF